ncbi:MAG: competence protein TfoX [Cereibacter sphaeroides]|uniref:Competence protein TfoX n=1 Tax=Cereibacter sphaeroides TaxID=1063 RepID=A0A2W5TQ95_CERSP|nr:MAG: competence protein TfoX [Cereibacter sphaeroides]
MATDPATVSFVTEQLEGAGPVTTRKMFGEYAVYIGAKVVALICDNQLFVKPTPGALALVPDAHLAPPYPGAKPHIQADARLDDPDALVALVIAAERDLPEPKPKKPKR